MSPVPPMVLTVAFPSFGRVLRVAWVFLGLLFVAAAIFTTSAFTSAVDQVTANYVHAESRWSKAQKLAVLHALRAIQLRETQLEQRAFLERDHNASPEARADNDPAGALAEAEQALVLHHAFRAARLAILADELDYEAADSAFEAGGVSEGERTLMIVVPHYGQIGPIAEAFRIWAEADARILALAEVVHRLRAPGLQRPALEAARLTINRLDDELSVLERGFSRTLVQARLDFSRLGWWLKLAVGVTVLGIATWAAARHLERLDRQKRDLEAAVARAEDAAASKSRFLATMSHEIRTPMNAVLGMGQLLLDSELSSEQRDQLAILHRSADSLLHIINDILDFSKIEAGRLDLERAPFRLAGPLETTRDLLTGVARTKGIELRLALEPGLPDAVLGDSTRLQQVLVNLVGNALKFTSTGTVELGARARPLHAEKVEIEIWVQDTGIGLAPDQIELLFTPFCQADSSTTRRFGGTGLGLTICKQLVELMGGRIGVESEGPGRGSTFRFSIPATVAATETSSIIDPAYSTDDVSGLRLLVAEDNPVNQKVIEAFLARLEIRFDIVRDGWLALEFVEAHAVDVVLMDIEMPQMDGIEATRAIRASSRVTRQPHIVALTANAFTEDERACLEAGMDGFLRKPVRTNELKRALLGAQAPSSTRFASST